MHTKTPQSQPFFCAGEVAVSANSNLHLPGRTLFFFDNMLICQEPDQQQQNWFISFCSNQTVVAFNNFFLWINNDTYPVLGDVAWKEQLVIAENVDPSCEYGGVIITIIIAIIGQVSLELSCEEITALFLTR